MKEQNKDIIMMGIFACLSIIITAFLIPSAWALYSGETILENNTLGTDKINWLIVDNETEITILPEITFNSTDIIIYFPTNMPPNSFKLVFIEEKTNEVIKEINVGGSGSTKTVYKNNTITKDNIVYKDKEIKGDEVIKEVPVEKIVNVSKPFYKNFWFYVSLIIIVIALYLSFKSNNTNIMQQY